MAVFRGNECCPETMTRVSTSEIKKVIDAEHRIAKRRYGHEFNWKAIPKVEEAIVIAIGTRRERDVE